MKEYKTHLETVISDMKNFGLIGTTCFCFDSKENAEKFYSGEIVISDDFKEELGSSYNEITLVIDNCKVQNTVTQTLPRRDKSVVREDVADGISGGDDIQKNFGE